MDIKANSRSDLIKSGLNHIAKRGVIAALIVAGIVFMACGRDSADSSRTELIRVGSSQITVRQFKKIQDLSQDYYWQEGDVGDSSENESKSLRLLNQVTEELLLIEKAKDLKIDVSDRALEAAVQNIKADYPEGTFEQVLLENAVSYDFWRERLKVRLLMDKVIEKELESHVNITPEDISSYYKEHYAGVEDRKDKDQPQGQSKDINEVIVKRLRKLKAEENYKKWIKELEQAYPVHVNWKAWKKMTEP